MGIAGRGAWFRDADAVQRTDQVMLGRCGKHPRTMSDAVSAPKLPRRWHGGLRHSGLHAVEGGQETVEIYQGEIAGARVPAEGCRLGI